MFDYNKFYQPKKIGSKRVKLNTKKNKSLYKKFLQLVILLCIVLSFATLFDSIGNIITIINFNYSHKLVQSNFFLNISDAIFDNFPSIFTILIVTVLCNEKKGILISFFALLIFFAMQNALISDENNQLTFFYFFKNPKLVLFKNLGITSLNMGPVGGIIFGLFCSWIINKLYELKLPKIFAFLNGMPVVIISLFIFILFYTIIFLLFYIFIFFIILKLYESAIIVNDIIFYNFIFNLLNIVFLPLGFSNFLNNVFFADKLYDISHFISKFKFICTYNMGFKFSSDTNSWNNDAIQSAWKYLICIKTNSCLSINQWILLLPFNSLPTTNTGHFVNLFDWFNQMRVGQNYSIIFGFFIAFGLVLILTSKKDNLKSTLFIVSFMLLMVLLTGKTYALSLMLLFVSPLLYFGLYLPITLLNSFLINLLDIHLFSLLGAGLIDFIAFGIIPSAKGTNFGWVFLFSFIWFCVSFPILYWVTIKKDLPFIGRTETIVPRLTHRQIHDMFNC